MDETTPAAFLSYAHHDDEHDGGNITAFRKALEGEVRAQTGRRDVRIFQDRDDIAWGDAWKERIDRSLDAVTFLVPVLTPSFLASPHCRQELRRFLDRERRLGRKDLILPVYWINIRDPENQARQNVDDLAKELAARQYADWRKLRFEQLNDKEARRALAALATRIHDALDTADYAERSLEAIRGNVTEVVERAIADVRTAGVDVDVVRLVNILVDVIRDAPWLPEEKVLPLRWTSQSRVDRPPSAARESTSAPLDIPPGVEPAKADSFQSGALSIVDRTVMSIVTATGDSVVADRLLDAIRDMCILGDPAHETERTRALVDPLREVAQAHIGVLHAAAERADRETREAAEQAAETAEKKARETAAANAEAIRAAHQHRDEAVRRLRDAMGRQAELERQLRESAATIHRLADVERELALLRQAATEREAEVAQLRSTLDFERERAQEKITYLQNRPISLRQLAEHRQRDHVDHDDNNGGRTQTTTTDGSSDEFAATGSPRPLATEQATPISVEPTRPDLAEATVAASPLPPGRSDTPESIRYTESDRSFWPTLTIFFLLLTITPWVIHSFVEYDWWGILLGILGSIFFGFLASVSGSVFFTPGHLSFDNDGIDFKRIPFQLKLQWEEIQRIRVEDGFLKIDLSENVSVDRYKKRNTPPRLEEVATRTLIMCELRWFRRASPSNIEAAIRIFAGSIPVEKEIISGASTAWAGPNLQHPGTNPAAARAARIGRVGFHRMDRPPEGAEPATDADTEPGVGVEPDGTRSRRTRRVLFVSLSVLILVIAGGAGAWTWVNSHYYVGLDGDLVAVFRGVEGDPIPGLGHTLVYPSDRTLTEFPPDLQAKLHKGIDVGSQEAGLDYINKLPARPAEEEKTPIPSPRPSATPSVPPTPTRPPSAYSATNPAIVLLPAALVAANPQVVCGVSNACTGFRPSPPR